MNLFKIFYKRNEENQNHAHRAVRVGNQTLYLNSRGRIPVILQRANGKFAEVFHLIYMDREALQLSVRRREIYFFRRSTGQVEQLRQHTGRGFAIQSIKIAKNKRSLLLTVAAENQDANDQFFSQEVRLDPDAK